MPVFLSPSEMDRAISTADTLTATGRRNRAVLLLLARLGLRAGEIVLLELGDIRWRAAELVIPGKGRVFQALPLMTDVGEALARYLRDKRRCSECRRVFLSVYPHLINPSQVLRLWATSSAPR